MVRRADRLFCIPAGNADYAIRMHAVHPLYERVLSGCSKLLPAPKPTCFKQADTALFLLSKNSHFAIYWFHIGKFNH